MDSDYRRFAVVLIVMALLLFPPFIQPPLMAVDASGGDLVSVIVKLEDPALASYKGGTRNLAATSAEVTGEKRLDASSPPSRAYRAYLEEKHKAFETDLLSAIPSSRMVHRYDIVFGGVSVIVPGSQVTALSQLPGVKAVYPDRLKKPDTDKSPAFIKATQLWSQLGGAEKAGEGIVVGVIDTGIWPEHPSFSDPDPSGKAYPAPTGWGGTCEAPLDSSTPITCTNKLIGARLFLDTYKLNEGPLPAGEFNSARDAEGHGTHTTSTAAGNNHVKATVLSNVTAYVSGIAPRAHVAMYKALGPNGGYDSDLVAAIQKAVEDGVDVINYSIGPSGYLEDPYTSADDAAFLDAYKAGVFVATSAGNSGPDADTVNHLGGWTTTVAASTENRFFMDKLTLKPSKGRTLTLSGASLTGPINTWTPVLLASSHGDALCQNPFAGGTFNGAIVACERGVNGRVEKGYNVLQGGASGMILYNPSSLSGISTDNHFVPATHLEYEPAEKFLDFFADNTGVTAKLTKGAATTTKGDIMASFSSRGGAGQTYGISKPDVTAPGVQILAGHTPQPLDISGGKPGQLFQAIQGTSMASPHVAGAGALLKALHPTWSPGQIKSALMTTAITTKVMKEDGATAGDTFDYGSGRIDLSKAGKPGVTFSVPGDDFVTYKSSLWTVNYPSVYLPYLEDSAVTITRTAHSELTKSTKWQISATSESDLTITVPKTLTVPGGGDVPFQITISGAAIPTGEVRSGVIKMTGGGSTVHIPVTVVKRTGP